MHKSAFVLTLFTCSTVFGGTYIVRPGDTISDILFENVPGRIYGKSNNLAKFLKENPHISNPNNISVGQRINLDFNKSHPSTKKQYSKNVNLNQSLLLSLHLNSESINAVEATSGASEIATSDLSYGISARWVHKWSKKYRFFFDASLSKYSFSVASNKVVTKADQTKAYGGVGFQYLQGENHNYSLEAGLEESFLLTSKNISTLEIQKIVIPSLSLSGNHTLKKFNTGFGLRGIWNAGVLLPTSQAGFDSKIGSFWSIGGGSFYEDSKRSYDISILYGQRNLETDDIKQTDKDIGLRVGVGFSF